MEHVMLTMIGIGFIVLAFCVWVLICNEKTYRARLRIIDQCSDASKRCIAKGEDWHEAHSPVERVTYEQHMWALVLLRDPQKLYE